jgi:hypothetical protein
MPKHPAGGTQVVVVTKLDGLRLLPGPLRLEQVGGTPCAPAWHLEEEGSRRWLSASDGTWLALEGSTDTRLRKDLFFPRCVSRGGRNSMRLSWFCADSEPVELVPVLHGKLREAACERAPELWRASAQGQLLPGVLAIAFVLLCWLSGRRQQRRLAAVLNRLASSRADGSSVRLAWRSSRDAARSLRLVSRLREGTHVAELHVFDTAGKSLNTWEDGWLRLADDHASMLLTPASGDSVVLHRINLTELKQLRFGERATARQSEHVPAVPATLPWRCLHLATRGCDYTVRFSEDGPAHLWLEGLQALLHESGHLKHPIRPATLLWLRVRMRLAYLSARDGVSRQRLLADAFGAAGTAADHRMQRAIK